MSELPHYYITVDRHMISWKVIMRNKIKKLKGPGVVHVFDSWRKEEIEVIKI